MFRLSPGFAAILNDVSARVRAAKLADEPKPTGTSFVDPEAATLVQATRPASKRARATATRTVWVGDYPREQWLHPTKGWRFAD